MNIQEITFTVERDEESGWLTASWDAPNHGGGITTQGKDLGELEKNVREAVECHFDNGAMPRHIRLRFLNDAVLATTWNFHGTFPAKKRFTLSSV